MNDRMRGSAARELAPGVGAAEWYRKRTLGSLLDDAARRWGAREAFVFEGRRWTYADWKRESDRLARGLLALGVEPGDRVALWLPNRPEWLFSMFAIPSIGACTVPLNTRYRTDDVAYALAQSRSSVLLTLDRSGPIDYRAILGEALGDGSRFPALRRVVMAGRERLPGALGWDELLALGDAVPEEALAARAAAVDPDGLMLILYTSGTTGDPKGVMHSHCPIRSTHERALALGMTHADVHMSYLPLFHIYAYSEIATTAVLTGGRQVLMDVFDAERALDLAEAEGATVLHGFEAHWLDLLAAQERRPRRISMRLGTLPSGMESTIPVAERVQDVFGPTVSGYGMSEIWAFVAVSNPSHSREQRVRASGYPMNDYEFRVVDPASGRDLPPGAPGELLVRGYAVTRGYWERPEETAAAFTADGWLRTGDLALLRPDGHLVFLGRCKDMLKVGGENVSPTEVEAYLRAMPEVRDAAVVGHPDPRLAEVPVAFVIAEPGAPAIAGEALIERLRGRIASFKIPRHVLFVDAFPMTASGKIRKVELRALALERLGEPGRRSGTA